MLHIQNLVIKRGGGSQAHTVVLNELQLQQGQIIAITGSSGCGKSTLLESIGLLLKPTQLTRYDLGLPAVSLTQWQQQPESLVAQLRAEKIGFVLQNGGLIPYLSVQDNIQLPRRILGKSRSSESIEYAIEQLGIQHLQHQLPATLSIGERQRVAFVRAIAHEPQLVLADEPTAALDPIHAQALFQLFTQLVTTLKMSALVVSHDWELVKKFGLAQLQAQITPGVCHFV